MAIGTCAAYGGVPAMRNNPTGAMGLRDYLGWSWTSRLGIPIVNLPGCPVQPNNVTETLLALILQLGGLAANDRPRRPGPPALAVRPHRPRDLRPGGLRRAGPVRRHARRRRCCLVKLGCKGPVVKCNVPVRGWVDGIGGCPNVGGVCIGCTSAGFPDRFMPFMEPRSPRRAGRARRALHLRPRAALLPRPARCARTYERRAGVAPAARPSCRPATSGAGDGPCPSA